MVRVIEDTVDNGKIADKLFHDISNKHVIKPGLMSQSSMVIGIVNIIIY